MIDQIESLLGALADKIDAFSRDGRRVIIGCALVAGLWLPSAYFAFIHFTAFTQKRPPDWDRIGTAILICLTCYLTAAGLLLLVRAQRLTSVNWVMVTALGSFILACVVVRRVEMVNLLAMAFWFSVFTLPLSALVKFSGQLVRPRNW